MLKRYIGDRTFYRHVAAVAIPILIQNVITNFVALLDNIMVGQIGTLEMSGVSIANQLIFVYTICIYGGVAGAGIYAAQFFGNADHDGVRHSFRYKLLLSLLLSFGGVALFRFAGTPLVSLFLQGEGDPGDIQQTLVFGRTYLDIMLWGLVPFALSTAYSSTLRETGQTVVPMVAGVVAVFVNLLLNYLLIFGHWGLPQLNERGAAIATVISRYVELAIVMVWSHCNGDKHPFVKGALRSVYIPGWLLKEITAKSAPLLLNEFLWASGNAMLSQCYSVRGLDVVAAMNINTTLRNLTCVAFISMGSVTAIIIGQMLGAGRPAKEVRETRYRLNALSVGSCAVLGGLTIAVSGVFPQIFNTTDQVRHLATVLICVMAALMPFQGYTQVTYFCMRAGGKSMLTFLYDAGYMWVISVPLAYVLSRFTGIPIVWLYALCLSTEVVKSFFGNLLLKNDAWIQNLTNQK